MLGKKVWVVLHEPHTLWVQMVGNKYLQHTHFVHIIDVEGASYTWASIVKALNEIRDGFRIRLGKGRCPCSLTNS